MAPDLAARKVIVQAYLYYVLDAPTMSDAEYDKLSMYAADHWDELHPERQFCLGSPEELRASGHHIKFTVYAVDAARFLYRETHKTYPPIPFPAKWKTDRKTKLRYVTTTA